jgi:hypothetical protein
MNKMSRHGFRGKIISTLQPSLHLPQRRSNLVSPAREVPTHMLLAQTAGCSFQLWLKR